MKQKFSKSWKGSKQIRKQRKYLANAPLHIRGKMISSNLNKELRKKYNRRSAPIKKGDEVKILVGEFKKKTGKIISVDTKKYRVVIEGIQRKKKDGTKVNVYFHPSNLQIINLSLEDKKRVEAISRNISEKEKKVKSESKIVKEKK